MKLNYLLKLCLLIFYLLDTIVPFLISYVVGKKKNQWLLFGADINSSFISHKFLYVHPRAGNGLHTENMEKLSINI